MNLHQAIRYSFYFSYTVPDIPDALIKNWVKSVRGSSLLFNSGLTKGVLGDSLDFSILRKKRDFFIFCHTNLSAFCSGCLGPQQCFMVLCWEYSTYRTGLKAKPKKCEIGWVEEWYLGFHLGFQLIRLRPAWDPRPKRGWARSWVWLTISGRFVLNFSDIRSLLTDLSKKGSTRSSLADRAMQADFLRNKSDTAQLRRSIWPISGQSSNFWYYLLACPFILCSYLTPLQRLHNMKDANIQIIHRYYGSADQMAHQHESGMHRGVFKSALKNMDRMSP